MYTTIILPPTHSPPSECAVCREYLIAPINNTLYAPFRSPSCAVLMDAKLQKSRRRFGPRKRFFAKMDPERVLRRRCLSEMSECVSSVYFQGTGVGSSCSYGSTTAVLTVTTLAVLLADAGASAVRAGSSSKVFPERTFQPQRFSSAR